MVNQLSLAYNPYLNYNISIIGNTNYMPSKKTILCSLILEAIIILLPSAADTQLASVSQQLTAKAATTTAKIIMPAATSTKTVAATTSAQTAKNITSQTNTVGTQTEAPKTATSSQPTTKLETKTLSPQPESPKTVTGTIAASLKELSPQPDPPGKQSSTQITTATSAKTLNLQPEPPKDKTTATKTASIKPIYAVEIKAPISTGADQALGIMTTTTRTTTSYDIYGTKDSEVAWKMKSIDDSVNIKIKDKKIMVNSKETIDPSKLTSALQDKPTILAPLLSAIDQNYYYDVKLTAQENKAMAKFTYDGKEVSLSINNDLKVENKKLYLTSDSDNYEIKILPPELYGQMRAKIKNSDAQIEQIKLQIKDKKGVYEVKLKEKFKLFGFLPMKIKSTYTIESHEGEVTAQSSSWYKFLGTMPSLTLMSSFKLVKVQGQELQFMETEYPRVIIDSFTAAPLTLEREYGPVRLAWRTENAHAIQINAEIDNPYVPTPVIAMPVPTPASGYIDVYPSLSTKYELVVANRGGQQAERVVDVDVSLPNIVVQRLESAEPSALRERRGYSKMNVVFRNTGRNNFLGIINIDEITGGDRGEYYYYNPAFIANIPSGRTYSYSVYRGDRPRGMSPLENFVSGQTYEFNIRYSTDKQPLWEYGNDNVWTGSILVPTY